MEYSDRRTAELAALEAHRRHAADASSDPAPHFRLATFAQSMAMELAEESATALRNVIAMLDAKRERGEAWERAGALLALDLAVLGRRAEAHAEIDRVLAANADSASALAMRGELLFREGRDADALALLDRAVALEPEHPVASTIRAARRLP